MGSFYDTGMDLLDKAKGWEVDWGGDETRNNLYGHVSMLLKAEAFRKN